MDQLERSALEARRHGLGRVPSEFDIRDREYPIARALAMTSALEDERDPYRKWYSDVWTGDQGATSRCTAFAMLHALHDGPFTHRPYYGEQPMLDPTALYRRAQCLDPWGCRGRDDGTTMRAICRAAVEAGVVDSYFWTTSLGEALEWVATRGPLLLGSWWRSGMDVPRPVDGLVSYSGTYRGGHATKIDEILWTHEQVGVKNSWGRAWGDFGRFRMTFRDLEQAMIEGAELIALVEKRKAA